MRKWNEMAVSLVLFLVATLALSAEEEQKVRMELPAVSADRGKRRVEIDGRATGITSSDPVEFLLINRKSGHDYEALASTKAVPSDIREALEFIGVQAGRPVDIRKMRFWPRGDGVDIHYVWEDGQSGSSRSVSASELLQDRRSENGAFPTNGFLFVGSRKVEDPENGGVAVLAADVYEPHSIISAYNDPGTLIDVSWRASQGSEYGHIMPSEKYTLGKSEPVKVVISPAGGGQESQEIDLTLQVGVEKRGESRRESFSLKSDADGRVLGEGSDLKSILKEFMELSKEALRPYVTISFDHDMKVERIQKVCAFVESIENRRGIRIQPPPDGQLYYKAFLPDKVLYNRAERGLQPPELHIERGSDGVSASLVQAERVWDEEDPKESEIRTDEQKLADPAAFKDRLAQIAEDIPVLLVYAASDAELGTIMDYLTPVKQISPTVFILLE